jgi:hypothetical protein
MMRIETFWLAASAFAINGNFIVATEPLAARRIWIFPSFAVCDASNPTDAMFQCEVEYMDIMSRSSNK